MEIRNLLTFVQVAELNSFTRAAEALGYSQSTVSFQIKQLEDELSCLLFERINHTITLTERGAELLDYAQKIVRMTDEFNQSLNAEKPLGGVIHVLSPSSLCQQMLRNSYSLFHKEYPNISLRFTSADTLDMMRMLDRNEADIMLTLDTHTYKRDYVIAKEEPIGMHFVTGAGSKYDTGATLSLSEIASFPLILTEKNAGYRRPWDKLFAERSIYAEPILELDRTDVIAELLEEGVGVSYLPDFVTGEAVMEGRLKYLECEEKMPLIWKQLIYHKNKWMSKCLRIFIEYVKVHEFSNE